MPVVDGVKESNCTDAEVADAVVHQARFMSDQLQLRVLKFHDALRMLA